jgi:hypothetical protein
MHRTWNKRGQCWRGCDLKRSEKGCHIWQPLQAGLDMATPLWAAVHGIGIGLGQIIGAVFCQSADQKGGLHPVFAGFDLVWSTAPAVGDDEFVDGKAFR